MCCSGFAVQAAQAPNYPFMFLLLCSLAPVLVSSTFCWTFRKTDTMTRASIGPMLSRQGWAGLGFGVLGQVNLKNTPQVEENSKSQGTTS